jgi:hypothetical protein
MVSPLRPGLAWPGSFNDIAAQSTEETGGWWSEHDLRLAEQARARLFGGHCGPDGVRSLSAAIYTNDTVWLGRHFIPLTTFRRFAELAAEYSAKLIIVFHPYPCAGLVGGLPAAMDDALNELMREYPNALVYPREMVEHWPDERFTGTDHLRIGYEGLNSARVGKFVADALGIPPANEPLPKTDMPPVATDLLEPPVWIGDESVRDWRPIGLSLSTHDMSSAAIENANNERHYFYSTITGLEPGKPYIASIFFKPIGRRSINIVLRDADVSARGAVQGYVLCNPTEESVARFGPFYDSDMAHRESWFVCWGSIVLSQPTAMFGVEILSSSGASPYPGDNNSGIEFRGAAVHYGLKGSVGPVTQATTGDGTK